MKFSFVFCSAMILFSHFAGDAFGQTEATVDISQMPDQVDSGCCHAAGRQTGGITLSEMWNRELPDGTQHGHIRYWSTGVYYYHRPYNAVHYRQHRARLHSAVRPYAPFEAQHGFSSGYQYAESNPSHLFRPLVRKADPVTDRVDQYDDSRVLEFADSVRYRHAKTAWEEKRENEKGSRTPARLSSHTK